MAGTEKDGVVFAVNGQYLTAASARCFQEKSAAGNEGFLVCKKGAFARAYGGKGRPGGWETGS
jgi:hypothetical protein